MSEQFVTSSQSTLSNSHNQACGKLTVAPVCLALVNSQSVFLRAQSALINFLSGMGCDQIFKSSRYLGVIRVRETR